MLSPFLLCNTQFIIPHNPLLCQAISIGASLFAKSTIFSLTNGTLSAYNGTVAEKLAEGAEMNNGEFVREKRKGRRWTLRDLEGRTGIPQADLSRIENGHLVIGAKRALKLAGVFRVGLRRLYSP